MHTDIHSYIRIWRWDADVSLYIGDVRRTEESNANKLNGFVSVRAYEQKLNTTMWCGERLLFQNKLEKRKQHENQNVNKRNFCLLWFTRGANDNYCCLLLSVAHKNFRTEIQHMREVKEDTHHIQQQRRQQKQPQHFTKCVSIHITDQPNLHILVRRTLEQISVCIKKSSREKKNHVAINAYDIRQLSLMKWGCKRGERRTVTAIQREKDATGSKTKRRKML